MTQLIVRSLTALSYKTLAPKGRPKDLVAPTLACYHGQMVTSLERWLLNQQPQGFDLAGREAPFAVVMVVAADSDLAPQVRGDLDEMVAGVSEQISVLLMVDLPGNTGAAIVEITPQGIRPIAQEAEISTGDPTVLAHFFARALVSYSAQTRFALGFWGHGEGIFGDNDPHEVILPAALHAYPQAPRPRRRRRSQGISAQSMLPDETSGDVLTNREANSALAVAFARAQRTTPVDLIFFDACLNGSVEVFSELREFAQVVVASSLAIPEGGWNYKFWLSLTTEQMPAKAQDWAKLAVQAFESAHPQLGDFPAAQLAAFSTQEGDLVKAFAKIVKALREMKATRRLLVGLAAGRVQSIQFRENLDLGQLVDIFCDLSEKGSPLRQACRDFTDIFNRSQVAISAPNEHGEDLSGLTIWCPIKGDLKGVGRYYRKLSFSKKTKWFKLLTEIEADKKVAESQALG